MRMGAIILSLYLIENHRPRIIIGKDTHHRIISGRVMACLRDVNCQGKGANKRYNMPSGTLEMAPFTVETSESSPYPDSPRTAISRLLRSTFSRLPKVWN